MISNLFSLSLELYRSDQPVYSGVFIACCSLRFLLGWQYHLGSRFFTLGTCRFHCLADLVAYTTPLSRQAVCLTHQPVSVGGLYRLLWLDPRSTALAGRHILWHSDALNARTDPAWPPVSLSSLFRLTQLAGPLAGSRSAAWSPV